MQCGNITSFLLKFADMSYPEVILLISGKRKSGKDFISEELFKTIGSDKCCIVRISEPVKSYYAKENNLDFAELMSENAYKEHYRLEMIKWSDEVRKEVPGYFCKAACDKAPLKPIWIVSDIRRKTDITWFRDAYLDKIRTLRISADIETRAKRGFVFTNGVDDVTSECDLDDFNEWNLCVTNNNAEEFETAIQEILELIGVKFASANICE